LILRFYPAVDSLYSDSVILSQALTKEVLGAFATVISIYTYVPYFTGIYKGKTKPHAFSWIVWALILGITCTAQIVKKGGAGAWITIFETLATSTVAIIALISGEKNITRSDWYSFLAALAAIPLWVMTGSPLLSVILVTIISISGFWPTLRKSWSLPWSEVAQTYILSGPAYALSLMALQNMTWTTAFYPAMLMIVNTGFGLTLLIRRRYIGNPEKSPHI
ncbi:MAG: hypothetical protein V1721_05050, partial [Pseudomonadota bacterium]